jgi:hypothetical protein
LLLTKSDLADQLEEGVVTEDDIKAKKTELQFQIHAFTSSKAWEDFNVHKAFNKTLTAAYSYKYELDD